MTIRKGQDWGHQAPLPDDGVVVRTTGDLHRLIDECRRAGTEVPTIGLLGGDLARAVGATGDEDRLRSDRARTVPVDLGSVLVDGRIFWFASHLVARRRLWAGQWFVAMNSEYLGTWKMAPRAHPNDGRLDVLEGRLGLDDRIKARGRIVSGDHVPHPDIATRQTSAAQVDLERPTRVYLDGIDVGVARHLSVRIEPDALTCVV
ncbi:MAG: diacylglycerol/lipid kinase family protein [Acidimicrobiales bacterium]